jgi:Glycosyltransferase family 87
MGVPAEAKAEQPDANSPRAHGRFVLAALAIVAAWLVYDGVAFRSLAQFMMVVDHCPQPFCDFATYFLPMSRHLFDGTGPIPYYLYAPFFAILLLPLALLSDPAAIAMWGVVQVALSALLIVLPLVLVTRAGFRLSLLHVFIAMSSFPLLHNFKWGQISVPVTCALFGAWWCLERGRRFPAALLLAFATSLKFYPGWFAIVLLMRREWRTLGWFALLCAAFLVVLPVLFLGPGGTLTFYQGLANELHGAMGMALDPNSQSLDGVLGRLCYTEGSPFKPTADLITPIRWIVLPLSLAAAWWALRPARDTSLAALLILFCALPFVTPSSWPHYFVYLPAAALFLFSMAGTRGAWRWPIVALATLAAIAQSLPCWQVFGSWQDYSSWGVLFWANALTLIALVIVAVTRPAMRATGVVSPAPGPRRGSRARNAGAGSRDPGR